jgi:hypothetical protein
MRTSVRAHLGVHAHPQRSGSDPGSSSRHRTTRSTFQMMSGSWNGAAHAGPRPRGRSNWTRAPTWHGCMTGWGAPQTERSRPKTPGRRQHPYRHRPCCSPRLGGMLGSGDDVSSSSLRVLTRNAFQPCAPESWLAKTYGWPSLVWDPPREKPPKPAGPTHSRSVAG